MILQIPPSSRLRSWQSKHSGCSYQYLSVGVRSSRVSCSRVQATLDNCISFTRWGWTPSRSCRRGVLLACKAYGRFAICYSLLVVCVRTKGGVESALASFIRAPLSGTHIIAANSFRTVLAAVRMHTVSPPYLPRYSGTEDTREVSCALPCPNLPRLATLSVLLLCSVTPGGTSPRAVDLRDYCTEDTVGIAYHV